MGNKIIWVTAHCHLHPDVPAFLPPGIPRPTCGECCTALDINERGPVIIEGAEK